MGVYQKRELRDTLKSGILSPSDASGDSEASQSVGGTVRKGATVRERKLGEKERLTQAEQAASQNCKKKASGRF